MKPISLKVINNGEFEIVKITKDLHEEVIKLFLENFVRYENLCKACKIQESKDAIDEMEQILRHLLQEDLSFAACHRTTGKVAAICINSLEDSTTDEILENSPELNLKSPNLECIGEFLNYIERTCNIYTLWNVKCVFHVHFLATSMEFARQGLALSMTQFALEYAKCLTQLNSPQHKELPLHLREMLPEVAVASFTTSFTQKIGERLGFTTIFTGNYDQFSYEGKTFAENINDPLQKSTVFAAIRL